MSLQALTWAIEQEVSSPSTRCILISIANYANPEWCAWPKQETIAKESVQSVDTVQRRMPELVSKGLVRRIKLKRFGRRTHDFYILPPSPFFVADMEEIRPHLPASCDVIEEAERAESPENHATAICGSVDATLPQSAVHATATVRQQEPFMNKQVDSPQPPFRGVFEGKKEKKGKEESEPELDTWLERFSAVYPIPVTDVPRTKAWARVASEKQREDAITGARGYALFLDGERRRGRSRAAKDAHRWLAAEGYTGYIQRAKTADEQAARPLVETGSEAGRAWRALHKIARMSAPIDFNGRYQLSAAPSLRFLAFAQAGPHSQWLFIPENQHQQVGAWNSCLGSLLAGKSRGELVSETFKGRGFFAPWPYPPSVEGKIYTSTDPPSKSLAEQDAEFMEQNGLG